MTTIPPTPPADAETAEPRQASTESEDRMSTETKIVRCDVFAPWRVWNRSKWEDERHQRPVLWLGRVLLRWTVYRATFKPVTLADGVYGGLSLVAVERVSHHWTRRAAWLASSRLRIERKSA